MSESESERCVLTSTLALIHLSRGAMPWSGLYPMAHVRTFIYLEGLVTAGQHLPDALPVGQLLEPHVLARRRAQQPMVPPPAWSAIRHLTRRSTAQRLTSECSQHKVCCAHHSPAYSMQAGVLRSSLRLAQPCCLMRKWSRIHDH